MTRFIAIWLLVACPLSLAAEEVDFDRDIRPILSENCFFCHGPDANQRQADLRLDTKEDALSMIAAGDRASSELYARLVSTDPDELMPPPDSHRELSKEQVEMIGKWIDSGAAWTMHWAFRPLRRPEVPDVQPVIADSIHNPIDAFVQNRLGERNMQPSPQANRATLIRRLSLDLRGLPPSPQEVDAFLSDEHPQAYDRLVDRMLDSPAYGQRMAWNWLDAARYADTNGYQGDRERTMWPWRDWVVRAFNDNLPYDQFTIYQLAGDLLPDATNEQTLATGFCRNHMINGEGGRIAEENRIEYVMDMTETMGTVWLGLTLNCCRCHDHKYDPISNQEYYQLFSFFNQTPVSGGGGDPQTAPNLPAPSPQQQARLDQLKAQLAAMDAQLAERGEALSGKQAAWEREKLQSLEQDGTWHPLQPQDAAASRQQLRILPDQSILATGPNPANDAYTITGKPQPSQITGMRLEALRHETMTSNGLARSDSGNFVLTSVELAVVNEATQTRKAIKIASADATFAQGEHTIANAFDENPKSGWAVYEGRIVDREHAAVFRFDQPADIPEGSMLEIVLRHDSVHKNHNLGRFRLSLTATENPKLTKQSDTLVSDLRIPSADRNDEQQARITKAHRDADAEYISLRKQREAIVKDRSNVEKQIPKVMVMKDRKQPRETFMLTRGLYNKPAQAVTAALPQFLPPPAESQDADSLDRLTLARWLVTDENPLTARVTVNRFWQQVFGMGLVKTPEDFGRQGEIPLQMDLLNWLAADFRDSGWDVKALMRTIVTSHTYRQSSKIRSAEEFQADPDNRWYARGSRYRLPSWMLRDQALAVSGLLSAVDQGPPVNTYQPEGVWEEASFGKKKYTRDAGEKLYRRSLYTFWRRIIAPTMFFDAATRQTCTVKPGRTNTPLHALQTLNNTAYVEAARVLAEVGLQTAQPSDAARIDFLMRRVLARPATQSEREVFLAGLERTRAEFRQTPAEAEKLVAVGEAPRDESIDVVEQASWAALCLAMLNLDETLNRE